MIINPKSVLRDCTISALPAAHASQLARSIADKAVSSNRILRCVGALLSRGVTESSNTELAPAIKIIMLAESPLCLSPAATLYIALHSACPGPRWLDRVAPTLGRQGEAPVIFVAGANKGYGLIALLNRFGDRGTTPSAWQVALRRYKQRSPQAQTPASASDCGVCGACREPQPPLAKSSRLVMHAFELLQANSAWLAHGTRKALGKGHGTRKAFGLVLTRAAVSNASGHLLVPVGGKARCPAARASNPRTSPSSYFCSLALPSSPVAWKAWWVRNLSHLDSLAPAIQILVASWTRATWLRAETSRRRRA